MTRRNANHRREGEVRVYPLLQDVEGARRSGRGQRCGRLSPPQPDRRARCEEAPCDRSRPSLRDREEGGRYTGFLHQINRATTSNSGFVRKAVKQGRAMIAHGYKRRDICDRVRAFSAFDERKGWWPAVQGRILKRLSL